MSSKDKTKLAVSVCDLLGKVFRVKAPEESGDLVEAMLAAILMEDLPESKAHQAVKRIQAAFVDWNEARVTSETELVEQMKEPQVDQRTSGNMRRSLDRLYADRGEFALDFLKAESFSVAWDCLVNSLGMPPRPAARLMLFSLGKPALPLTEEVKRVAGRAGLIGPSWDDDRAQKSLERVVPSLRIHEFYELTVQHAETTCLAVKPKCSHCVLRNICAWYAEQADRKEKPRPAPKAPKRLRKTKKTKKVARKTTKKSKKTGSKTKARTGTKKTSRTKSKKKA